MFNRCFRAGWHCGVSMLTVLILLSHVSSAHALLIVFESTPAVTGGVFVNPSGQDPTFNQQTRMSFSVAGDYSVQADGTSSTVTVTIQTELLTLRVQGPFIVNTDIDGSFGSNLPGTSAEATEYSASSDVLGVSGSTASVSLISSPVSLPTVPPNGLYELAGSSSTSLTIDPGYAGQYYIEQTTTISFSGVTAGEVLQIHLPDNTSLFSVPEPSSLSMLLSASLFVALFPGVEIRCGSRDSSRSKSAVPGQCLA